MELFERLLDTLLHFGPEKVSELAHYLGPWLYIVIFAIIFAETGLVLTPFLPGDSLLFAIGAVAATPGSSIDLWLMTGLLFVAAVLGDAVNYAAGHWIGPKVFKREDSIFLNRKHLLRAQEFYDRHGGKTIILARFIPIVRTFAPFVAGIGKMQYPRFALYNVVGAAIWIPLFLVAGYYFASHPFVQKQFHLVIGVIIVISVLPAVWEIVRARRASAKGESALLEATTLEATTLGEDPLPR